MERPELVLLMISVILAVIVVDYLYSVTGNVLLNAVVVLFLTPVVYFGASRIARAAGYPRDHG